ncbi:hypothetical protein BDW59DRAFT_166063 [Aspergillus cavernicola]|uniref:LysM domain-containing protein n=1 Tax=Aspergillus cavernicola TaxID=176166 RepID=A0ABR4HP35_9EURO
MAFVYLLVAGLAFTIGTGSATQFITENTLPSDSLSSGCAEALAADVACPRQIGSFTTGMYYPVAALEEACTASCQDALASYEEAVGAACSDSEVYDITESHAAPVSFIPTLLYYHFNKACIEDDGRWCNQVAASSSSENDTAADIDMCDNCFIKQFQFQAGSPMYGGFALQVNYSSLTQSCSKTGFPLASSTTPFPGPSATSIPPPSASCAGRTYTVQGNDTCQSISQSQGIGTAWMLQDNGLEAWCNNFPTEGDLCIESTCTPYVVRANDTCKSIALANSVSEVQLMTWNPIVGSSCRSIASSVGDNNNNDNLRAHGSASPNQLILKFGISLKDFLFLNAGVNNNCTNLYAEESYCVAPVGPIDQYPGHPDYIPPETSISTVPYTNLPKATYTPPKITGLPTSLPLAPGTRKDCFVYAVGSDLEVDIGFTFFTSVCDALAQGWGISLEELQNWNPSLNTTNSTACAPEDGYRYCMGAYNGATVTQTVGLEPTGTAYPIREGTTENCDEFEAVVPPMTCSTVLNRHGITIAQFYEWNPAVGEQCGNLWLNYRYCIRVGEPPIMTESSSATPTPTQTPTTTTPATTTTTTTSTAMYPDPPGPTQRGVASNCNAWHLVESSDGSCWAITQGYGITLEEFYEW